MIHEQKKHLVYLNNNPKIRAPNFRKPKSLRIIRASIMFTHHKTVQDINKIIGRYCWYKHYFLVCTTFNTSIIPVKTLKNKCSLPLTI